MHGLFMPFSMLLPLESFRLSSAFIDAPWVGAGIWIFFDDWGAIDTGTAGCGLGGGFRNSPGVSALIPSSMQPVVMCPMSLAVTTPQNLLEIVIRQFVNVVL
jgi:hypothetical protein